MGKDYQSFLSKDDRKQDKDKVEDEDKCPDSPRTIFSNMRNARAQATFNLMMRMAPNALEMIRQEFYARSDSVTLTEFVHIMSKHLFNNQDDEASSSQVKNQDLRSFGSDMYELFKEVDVNGDGQMEWDEFTKFTVEKASSLNQSMVMTSIPEYFDNTEILDNCARTFRRGNITSMVPILNTGMFAVLEEHRKVISIYHSSNGRLYNEIQTDAVPLAVEAMKGNGMMAAVFADQSLSTYTIDDNYTIPHKRNIIKATLPTPDIQMSMAWMPSSELLYTGASSGNIMSWNMSQNQLVSTMSGHSDIVMKLLALDSLDSLMSASLDMTIGVWDTYTNTVIHKLKGHRKGVFSMSYNPDFRLLVTSGFDHDALVWSPFVNSLVFKLKGHHSSLVGCQCVENSPELITADEAGVFKLWDVRTFQCIQTFYNNSNSENEPAEHLSCFFHSKVPTNNLNQVNKNPEIDDCMLFAGSRRIRCFEQKRIVHAKTTDLTNVVWAEVNEASLTIITVSEKNIIIWDLLLGSKIIV
jgi:WD40 repeat protein